MNQDSRKLKTTGFFDESFDLKEITWEISNALTIPDEMDHKEDSPTFSFAGADWKLRLVSFGKTLLTNEKFIDLCIIRLSPRFTEQKVNFKLSFQNKYGKEFLSFAACVSIINPVPRTLGVKHFMKNSALNDMKDNLAPNDNLIIVCQMRIKKVEVQDRYFRITGTPSSLSSSSLAITDDKSSDEYELQICEIKCKVEEAPSSNDNGMEVLFNNLKQVFLDGRMSDAVLKAEGKDFPVHKVILVARSPVFASMFQHESAEKKTNEVDIPDCTAESLEVFLHYLYTGSVETLSTSNVYNVYYAAHKYQVDDLKDKCVQFMMKNISVRTFCDVMYLSLSHGESELQKRAVDFFCQNNKEFIKTVQWMRYMEANTVQANKLFIKVLEALD